MKPLMKMKKGELDGYYECPVILDQKVGFVIDENTTLNDVVRLAFREGYRRAVQDFYNSLSPSAKEDAERNFKFCFGGGIFE